MGSIVTLIAAGIFIYLGFKLFSSRAARASRERLIDTYPFPPAIKDNVRQAYPHLTDAQADKVMDGLREYFQLCNIAGKRMVAMPSQAVDTAWHEFILFTRKYQYFCEKALGKFLHHTPAEAMRTPTQAQQGIKTAWKISCFREKLSPNSPQRLPLLFAMDAELAIADGFHYTVNCQKTGEGYCASHIGCGSGCGGCSGGDGCGSGCGGD